MKNSLRILMGVSALAFLLTASPVLAAEVDVDQLNQETGYDSENKNKADADNDRTVDVDNKAYVKNDADVHGDSGYNEQNKNTKGGDLDTGNVDATGEWENVVNKYALCDCLLGDNGLSVLGDQENNMTGAKSENKNKIDVDNDVTVDVDNLAKIKNYLYADLNTGYNEQNKNTKGGDMQTGDAVFDFMIANWANNSTGSDDGSGAEVVVDASQSNMNTGYDSENKNTVEVDNNLTVDVVNHAKIKNYVTVHANTGYNEQNKNTKGGDLETGDAEVVLAIENEVNNSDCCVVKGGDLTVEADQENNMTGAESENKNKVDVDNNVTVNVDNHAYVKNDLYVDANTGYNEQNKNTEAGSTDTGDVTIDLSIFNKVNSSI